MTCLAGAGLAFAGIALPLAGTWILRSVVVFGALVALARSGRAVAATLAAMAPFAVAHGRAHAVEASGDAAANLAGLVPMAGRAPLRRSTSRRRWRWPDR